MTNATDITFDYTAHDRHVPGRRALVMTATLVGLALIQIAVIVYVAGLRVETGLPVSTSGISTPSVDQVFFASAAGGRIDSTRFRAAEVSPGYDGTTADVATATPAGIRFEQNTAVAHVSFDAENNFNAPVGFTFREQSIALDLTVSPVAAPVTIEDPESIPARTEMFADATPVETSPAVTKTSSGAATPGHNNVSALVAYLGEAGVARMSARCGDLIEEAYRYDAGMMDLCHQVRAVL